MRALLPLLALALAPALLSGCAERDRDNPLDPGNPFTHGRPVGFEALAGDQNVVLRWTAEGIPSLTGFQVFRRDEGAPDFVAISGVLPNTTRQLLDLGGIVNGKRYDYRLYFVLGTGVDSRPAEDYAVPGPQVAWVVDQVTGQLVRLTPDGHRVLFSRTDYAGPSDVAVDPVSHRVWVSDNLGSRAAAVNPSDGTGADIPGLSSPNAIAVDPVDHTAWICDDVADKIWHFRQDGAPASPTSEIGPIDRPIGIALDPVDRSLWICERGANQVRRVTRDGVPMWVVAVDAPSRVTVDSTTGIGWVTSFDRGRVVRISGSGAPIDTLTPCSGPIGIAADSRRGLIWVADALGAQVVALRRDGTVASRTGGLPEVRHLSVDRGTGDVWVVAAGAGWLVRVAPGGAVLSTLAGFSRPVGIAVDPGVP